MPRIINAYADGNTSIADSLRSLGDSMFANQANKELIRQEGLKAARQNAAATAAAQAYRDNNAVEIGANDILNNPDSTAMGHQALARAALVPGASPGSLGTLQIGAGEGIGSTVQGQQAELANARTVAAMQEAAAQQRQDTQPYPTTDINGNPIVATNKTAIGTAPIPTAERIKALAIQKALEQQDTPVAPAATPGNVPVMPSAASNAPLTPAPAQAAAPSPVPAAQPTAPAPQTNSFPGLLPNHPGVPHPLVQQALGMPPGGQVFSNPTTGQVGLSYDGGRSVQDASTGQWYVGAGNGFLPASNESAQQQVRANNLKTEAAQPLPAPPTAGAPPQSVIDAGHTAGFDSLAQKLAPDIVEGVTGGEYGASYNRARENLDNLATNTRSVIASAINAPGTRATVANLEAIEKNMPVPGRVTGMTGVSAEEERNSTISFIKNLRDLYAAEQKEANNPNTPPADVEKIAQHLRSLREVIGQWEKMPAQPNAAPPAAAPQQAPAPTQGIPPRATNIKTINGVTYYMLDGQLMKQ